MSADKIEVNISGDYAVLDVGDLQFYYGYEHVWCRTNRSFMPKCFDDECSNDWAFSVTRNRKIIAEFRRSTDLDEFNVEAQLIYGLGQFIAKLEAEGLKP